MTGNTSTDLSLALFFSPRGSGNPQSRGRLSAWRRGWRIALLFLATELAFACLAAAHTRSQSFSSWHLQDGRVRLTFSVQSLEATRLGVLEHNALNLNTLLVNHLIPRIAVHGGGEACRTVAGPQTRPAREGYLRVEWQLACPADKPLTISNHAFFDVAPSHVHYARVRTGDGPPVEYLFTNGERRRVISVSGQRQPGSGGTPFFAYLLLGVEHILIGVDHIAFLVALLLLCQRVREVVLMVTGFTVGHSITLSLAVLGVVEPNVPVIEALIGFTIALVAAENIGVTTGANKKIAIAAGLLLMVFAAVAAVGQVGLPMITLVGLAIFTFCYLPLVETQKHAVQLRPLLTVLFGLIHGFGFASVLMEMGLPPDRLVPALLGFNVGVEIGQLGIVAVLWATGSVAVRWFPAVGCRLATDTASAALCGLGLFWFIERAFGA